MIGAEVTRPSGREVVFSPLILYMTFANEAAMQPAVERYGVLSGGTETFERIAGYLSGSHGAQAHEPGEQPNRASPAV